MAISLSNLPWYGQIGAFVVVCGAAVWGFHNFYADAALAENEGQRTRLASLNADIERGLNTARRLPEFRAEISALERRLEELKAILPEQKDAQDILRQVHTLAGQSNLRIVAFNPRSSTRKALHEEWPIEMELEGSYHDLGYFFDRIARFPRIINIGEVQIRTLTEETSAATITARCTAMTFVLMDQAPPAAPAATPPGAAR